MDSAPVSEAGDLGSIPSDRTIPLKAGKPSLVEFRMARHPVEIRF